MSVIGFTTRSPWARHQRNRLAARMGSSRSIGSALVAA